MDTPIKKKAVLRFRSPNYPNYSLWECISFLNKLFDKYGSTEVHVEDAVTQMGHSPKSSTAGRVMASMFSFGLLESRGTKGGKFVYLSRLAQDLLLTKEDSPERLEFLQQAALKDGSMQAIWNKWGVNLPSEETIIKSLKIEMNYSSEGAKRFASAIVDTYDFAGLSKLPVDQKGSEGTSDKDKGKMPPKSQDEAIPPSLRKANFLLPGENREIIIYAPADLTEDEFDHTLEWLKFQKYGLVIPVKKDISHEQQEEQPKENN